MSQAERIFVRGTNTAMKINAAIAGYSITGVLKPGSRFKKIGSKSKRHVMHRRCAPLCSSQSRNTKLTLTDIPAGCGLGTMLRKTYENADSPTDRWQTWQKLSRAYRLWFPSIGPHKIFGIWRRLS